MIGTLPALTVTRNGRIMRVFEAAAILRLCQDTTLSTNLPSIFIIYKGLISAYWLLLLVGLLIWSWAT